MPEWSTLTLFLFAVIALVVTPGPAVLYIVTRSIDQGRGAGLPRPSASRPAAWFT